MSTEPLLSHRLDARRARIEKLIAHLHGLGVRPLGQFLDALSVEHGIGSQVVAKLEEYHRLDHHMLAATGGDRFPPSPVRVVRGGL
jgi:hypothetical protein